MTWEILSDKWKPIKAGNLSTKSAQYYIKHLLIDSAYVKTVK